MVLDGRRHPACVLSGASMKRIIALSTLLFLWLGSSGVQAQLLPDNTQLNVQSVNRWMQSNRDLSPFVAAIDARFLTPAAFTDFDAMTSVEQDAYIEQVLQEDGLIGAAQTAVKRHGWKSLGEYMRLSSRLGNAIAAYFLWGDLDKVSEAQREQLKEKADPAVLAVPQADIEFIRRNEKALQTYIQAYSAGK